MKKFVSFFVTIGIIFSLINFVHAEKYRLEKVLVFSRHNIRSPLFTSDSILAKTTNHKWFNWTSKPGELSIRGGQIETAMGQYFRKYLEHENFMTENYIPVGNEFRFYANSFQRTVATAQYFSSGMLPVANVKVEHKHEIGGWDNAFSMVFTNLNDKIRDDTINNILANHNAKDLKTFPENYKSALNLLENVLDFKNSPYAKENHIEHFPTNDLEIIFKQGNSISWKGGFQTASAVVDALILQYYEDPAETIFGKKLTDKQIQEIADIHNTALEIVVGTNPAAKELSKPTLKFLHDELKNDARKFTFICGHDTNVLGMLTALDVENYYLPNTIETKTPVGVKIVVEKRIGSDNREYAKIYLAYLSTRQIRNLDMLSLETPPQIFNLKFKGLQTNEDGLYLYEDFEKRLNDAIGKNYE